MPGEQRSNKDVTSYMRTSADIDTAGKTPTKEKKNSYAVEKILNTRTDLLAYNTVFGCTATDLSTTQSIPLSLFRTIFGMPTGKVFEGVSSNPSNQGEKQNKWKKGLN